MSLVDAALGTLVGVGVVCFAAPFYIVPVCALAFAYFRVQRAYASASGALKCFEASARSPLMSFSRQVAAGIDVVRGYGIGAELVARNHALIDAYINARLNWDLVNRWLGVRVDLIGAALVSLAALCVPVSMLVYPDRAAAGWVGLMLAYATKSTFHLSFFIRTASSLENQFTAVERVRDYTLLDQECADDEPPLHTASDGVDSAMAVARTLSAHNVSVSYDDNTVLRNVSLSIRLDGTLYAVCGRTGCARGFVPVIFSL